MFLSQDREFSNIYECTNKNFQNVEIIKAGMKTIYD